DRDEVLAGHLNAHLDAHVVLRIEVPCARMADDVAIARLGKLRALPESGRQRVEAEGCVKPLAVADHAALIHVVRAYRSRIPTEIVCQPFHASSSSAGSRLVAMMRSMSVI